MLNGDLPAGVQTWIVSGFFGGYTTFSTFVYETLRLVESESWRQVFMEHRAVGTPELRGRGSHLPAGRRRVILQMRSGSGSDYD